MRDQASTSMRLHRSLERHRIAPDAHASAIIARSVRRPRLTFHRGCASGSIAALSGLSQGQLAQLHQVRVSRRPPGTPVWVGGAIAGTPRLASQGRLPQRQRIRRSWLVPVLGRRSGSPCDLRKAAVDNALRTSREAWSRIRRPRSMASIFLPGGRRQRGAGTAPPLQLSERDPVFSRVPEEVCRLTSIGSRATEYNLKPIGTARPQQLFVPPPFRSAMGRALLPLRWSCRAGRSGLAEF